MNTLPIIQRTTEESNEVVGELSQAMQAEATTAIPIWFIVVLSILGILSIASFILFFMLFLRQRGFGTSETEAQPKGEKTPKAVKRKDEKRALPEEGHSNKTMRLWSDTEGQQERVSIIIRDLTHPECFYKLAAEGGILIGRTSGDVLIPYDQFVSSKHCEITYCNGILYVEDLDSANGTFYESEKIKRKTAIANGSVIKVGETEFKIELLKEKKQHGNFL